jgi:soluble lytic murein transglycosylase-like protein
MNATKQATRDKYRQAVGGSTRVVTGLASPAVSVGAALAGSFVGTFFNKRMVEAVQDVNQMMVRALSDPEYALDAMKYAGQMTTKRQAREALFGSAKKDFAGAAETLGFGGAKAQKGQALAGAKRAAAVNLIDALTPNEGSAKEVSSSFPSRLKAAPAPTPSAATNAPAATGKKLSFEDLLGSTGAAAPTPTTTPSAKPAANQYSAVINKAADNHGIDAAMLHAIADQESKFKPKAVGPKTRYGQAKGMFQIMDQTAKGLKVADRFDVAQSAEGAAKLLAQLKKQFGDEKLAIAAYNWRPAALKGQMKILKVKGIEPTWENLVAYGDIPTQTELYVPSVLEKRKKYIG